MVEQFNNALKKGEVLNGTSYRYLIEKVLGQGSFGITYLASVKMTGALGSIDANIKVAIKEFFMRDINGRSDATVTSGSNGGIYDEYKRKFTREALNLSKLQHPNIIKVIESFEANNTVYYVMEYISGGSLDDYIAKNNGLKEDEAIRIIKLIGTALSFMHDNKMLHLDLKPSNIMMKESGDVVLIDFGLSKQYDEKGEPESSTKVGAGTPGYAPIEQANYREGKGFPVTMDIYALGATLFKMLTGVRPPEASDILNEVFPLYELQEHGVSDSLSACIAKAMAPIKKDRYQSVSEFISLLENGEATVVDVEVKDKKISRKRNHDVKEYRILPNTSRVKIEYSPMTPIETGRYIASIGFGGMSLGRFEGSTYFTYPINESRYKKFLSDLQGLNLSIKEEQLMEYNEFSEEPEKLVISLFDNVGELYAKYWISGWKNEFGNIDGDISTLNNILIRITPNLRDYLSGMYKQDKVNSSMNDNNPEKFSCNRRYNTTPDLVNDSISNPNMRFEIAYLTDMGIKSENKEAFGWKNTSNGIVFVVSEGQHDAGAAASALAVKSVFNYFSKDTYPFSAEMMIKESIGNASFALDSKASKTRSSLLSTCAVALVKNNSIYWGSVGDNRIYYHNDKGLSWLNRDEILNNKNALIGDGTILAPTASMYRTETKTDDILLLCTDGLSNFLEESEISQILSLKDISLSDKICSLHELALQKGSDDNITILAVRFIQVHEGVENKKEVESPIKYRWGYALFTLAIETGLAYFMLTQNRVGDLDSDGRLLSGLYFLASLLCVYYLFNVKNKISSQKWRLITIISTIVCLANSFLLPIWNGSLTGAYFLLSIGLSLISSFTTLIKKNK